MASVLQDLSQPGLAPFLAAAILVAGLLALEVVLMLAGLDTTVGEAGGVHLDHPGSVEAAQDLGHAHPEGDAPFQGEAQAPGGGWAGLLHLIGLAGLPLTVWLAVLSGGFAVAGLVLQGAAQGLTGAMLPRAVAVALALVAAVAATRGIGRAVLRVLPRETTTAISERSFGNRMGRVVIGTARRGSPAQVRFADGHGNTHYAMAEPLEDDDAIAGGTEVMILRTRDGALRLVRVT